MALLAFYRRNVGLKYKFIVLPILFMISSCGGTQNASSQKGPSSNGGKNKRDIILRDIQSDLYNKSSSSTMRLKSRERYLRRCHGVYLRYFKRATSSGMKEANDGLKDEVRDSFISPKKYKNILIRLKKHNFPTKAFQKLENQLLSKDEEFLINAYATLLPKSRGDKRNSDAFKYCQLVAKKITKIFKMTNDSERQLPHNHFSMIFSGVTEMEEKTRKELKDFLYTEKIRECHQSHRVFRGHAWPQMYSQNVRSGTVYRSQSWSRWAVDNKGKEEVSYNGDLKCSESEGPLYNEKIVERFKRYYTGFKDIPWGRLKCDKGFSRVTHYLESTPFSKNSLAHFPVEIVNYCNRVVEDIFDVKKKRSLEEIYREDSNLTIKEFSPFFLSKYFNDEVLQRLYLRRRRVLFSCRSFLQNSISSDKEGRLEPTSLVSSHKKVEASYLKALYESRDIPKSIQDYCKDVFEILETDAKKDEEELRRRVLSFHYEKKNLSYQEISVLQVEVFQLLREKLFDFLRADPCSIEIGRIPDFRRLKSSLKGYVNSLSLGELFQRLKQLESRLGEIEKILNTLEKYRQRKYLEKYLASQVLQGKEIDKAVVKKLGFSFYESLQYLKVMKDRFGLKLSANIDHQMSKVDRSDSCALSDTYYRPQKIYSYFDDGRKSSNPVAYIYTYYTRLDVMFEKKLGLHGASQETDLVVFEDDNGPPEAIKHSRLYLDDATDPEHLVIREVGYEKDGIAIYDFKNGFVKVRYKGRWGWIHISQVMHEVVTLDDLANGAVFRGEALYKKIGDEKIGASVVQSYQDLKVDLIKSIWFQNRLWLKIKILPETYTREPSTKVNESIEGFIPAYDDKGQLNFKFYPRGA